MQSVDMSTREMEKREMILAKTLVCGFSIRFHRHRWYLVSSSQVFLLSSSRLMNSNRLTVHKDLRQSIPQPPQRRQPGSFSLPVTWRCKLLNCMNNYRGGKVYWMSKGLFSDTSLIVCSLRPLYLGSQQAWTSCTVNIVWRRWLLLCSFFMANVI